MVSTRLASKQSVVFISPALRKKEDGASLAASNHPIRMFFVSDSLLGLLIKFVVIRVTVLDVSFVWQ